MIKQHTNQAQLTSQKFERTLAEHRSGVLAMRAFYPPANTILIATNIVIGEHVKLALRIYRKHNSTGLLPTFIYIPGTAFTANETAFTDVICSHIAEKSNCQVIAVYPRLAPEAKLPWGSIDVYLCVKKLLSQAKLYRIDKRYSILGGYSSGGYYALQATLLGKKIKQFLPIKHLCLISPILDLTRQLQTQNSLYSPFELETKDNSLPSSFIDWVINRSLPLTCSSSALLQPFWLHDNEGLPNIDFYYGGKDCFRAGVEYFLEMLTKISASYTTCVFHNANHLFLWHQFTAITFLAKRIKNVFSQLGVLS